MVMDAGVYAENHDYLGEDGTSKGVCHLGEAAIC